MRLALPVAAAALAGCASTQHSVALPAHRQHPAAADARLSSPRPSARDQVITAYTGYWQAISAASDSRDPSRAAAILSAYVPAAAVAAIVANLRSQWARHEIADGQAVPHILSVRVRGGRAVVHDCLDLSRWLTENTRTGEIGGSYGNPRQNAVTTLAREHGRWVITNYTRVMLPCAQ
jgi:hypothetical protein